MVIQNRLGNRPLWLVAVMTVCLAVTALLPAQAALAVLQPGDAAPAFLLKDTAGRSVRFDTSSTSAALIVFVKPADKYTSDALNAVNQLLLRRPEFGRGLMRWIVCSRMSSPQEAASVAAAAGPQWRVLLDSDDRIYERYRIIATPTVVLVGTDRVVKAANPGYDLNMENYLETAIANTLNLPAPKALTKEVPKIGMAIQMGRRMAERGQYERALEYYEQAGKEEKLPPDVEIEKAGVLIELLQWQPAEEILQRWEKDPHYARRVAELRKRLEALKEHKKGATPAAPKVTR